MIVDPDTSTHSNVVVDWIAKLCFETEAEADSLRVARDAISNDDGSAETNVSEVAIAGALTSDESKGSAMENEWTARQDSSRHLRAVASGERGLAINR